MRSFQRHLLLFAALLLTATTAFAQGTYRVTITNITKNQIIGPPVLASHSLRAGIFSLGARPSAELAAVAEDADASGLVAALEADDQVLDVVQGTGPLLPGDSVSFDIEASQSFPRLSAIGMLVTTNDAFFGLDSFTIIGNPWRKTVLAPAYDAGSEANTESCEHIPGPPCGNPFVRVTEGAEGFVHVHQGIQGIGPDLSAAGYDWRNPTAYLTIVPVNP